MAKKDIWRQPSPTTEVAVGCRPLIISTGTIVINKTRTVTLDADQQATYSPFCPNGVLPIRIFQGPSLLEMGDYGALEDKPDSSILATSFPTPPGSLSSTILPFPDWQSPFYTSSVPATVAVAVSTTVTWTLSLALLCSPRRPILMKALVLIASICMTILSAVYMDYLRRQYESGYADGFLMVNSIEESTLESVAVMICKFALLLAELRTLMRLFPRKREQRLILFFGALVICVDRVLWAVSEFAPSSPQDRTDSVDAIVVFAYLFSIATAIVYAGAILLYSWWKWRIAYKPSLLLMAFLSHISTFLPIVLFVLDLADQYLDSWSTYAKLVSLLCASVCVWVWVDRIEDYEKALELHSVLGRQQYTEDHSPFDFQGGGGGKTLSMKKSSAKHIAKGSDDSNSSGHSTEGIDDGESSDGSYNERKRRAHKLRNSAPPEDGLPTNVNIINKSTTSPGSQLHSRTQTSSTIPPSNPSKTSKQYWNSRWLGLLKFNILNRPATSSSMQTTYIVSSTDQTGMPEAIPLEAFNDTGDGPMTIHKHPFKSTDKTVDNDDDDLPSLSSTDH